MTLSHDPNLLQKYIPAKQSPDGSFAVGDYKIVVLLEKNL